jgi:nicotinate-nucleotide adenylyltransferase
MPKEKSIGLFFGSFNPIHNGHLMIANWMKEYTGMDEVWFVVSPLNPFKKNQNLLADYHRIELANRAIMDYPGFRVSNIETRMPRPSYTIDTLTYLQELHPEHHFVLIMGSDQLPDFHRWKNAEQILDQYKILVYPRKEAQPATQDQSLHTQALLNNKSVSMVKAPIMEISSSFIREAVKSGKDVRFFVPPPVWEYMREMHFYE